MTTPLTKPGFAQVGSRYYPVLVAVFTALVIISNVAATKGVAFGPIITDGGFIVFPLTYIIGDVLAEVYGFAAARRAIMVGFAMNGLAALAFWVTVYLPAADFYPNQEHFANVVGAIAFYFGTGTVAVCDFTNYFQFTCIVIELSLNVCKAVDTGDNLCSVLAETVQDATQRFFTYLVSFSGNLDSTFGSSE